jgi:hypothetical protein
MNTTQRIAFGLSTLLLFGCGDDGEEGADDMGIDAGEPDEGVPEAPVFADLSAASQVDRMGKPALNTAAIPSGECGVTGESCKTTYNVNENPADDLTDFAVAAVAQLSGPDGMTNTSALWEGGLLTDTEAVTIAAAVWGDGTGFVFYGDILVIDTSMATGYSVVAGGRAPTDDVIDTTLDAITSNSAAAGNMAGVASDSIDANDTTFPTAFPHFADPNP